MKLRKYILGIALTIGLTSQAAAWRTHFAYNNITQIAMSSDKVFAISDGSLFSVDKQSEQIKVYNRQSGLHEVGITCIHYDATGEQLIIAYSNGKIDILSSNGVKYIGELYDKDMTQRKTIYNVTLKGRTAYLSTHYGVQTMNLRDNKLVDSYWLRPGGQETPVKDVVVTNDSIYAFTDDSLFSAALSDNLVDYTYWHREIRSGRIAPDTEKGIHYQDGSDNWYAGGAEGIVRYTATDRLTYKPNGPMLNKPYRMTAKQGQVWVVPGGAWAAQDLFPGIVMRYDGTQWINIPTDAIQAKTGMAAKDFMDVAVDPQNINHYFIPSYGTGLYEFDHDTLVRHDIAGGDNTLVSVIANQPEMYTRVIWARFDANGHLWFLNAGSEKQLQCVDASHVWHAITVRNGNAALALNTPGGLVFDNRHPHRKWIGAARALPGLGLLDDNGTWEEDDDQFIIRSEWTDQHGQTFRFGALRVLRQMADGRILMGTENGITVIESETDFFTSDRCFRPEITDDNGDDLLSAHEIMDIDFDEDQHIWVGTKTAGVYVLDDALTEVLAHYTTDNSAMPSNSILSLAIDESSKVWIGTAEGLVEYDPDGSEEGLNGQNGEQTDGLEMGSMMQWKLHLSYVNATEVVAAPHVVYAVGNSSLFAYDRADGTLKYWSKASGLNGSTIAHIAYDKKEDVLVIGYTDGHIDLLDRDGKVTQIPDLNLKAGTIALTINSITSGSRYTYLAMPFGIVAINTKKGEVADTYYIGSNAAALDIQQVVEMGDSLYAFSFDTLYKASLHDNLVDYSFWKSEAMPCEKIQQAVVYQDKLYALQHDSLYMRNGSSWELVRPEAIDWIHASDGQLLFCTEGHILYRLTEDGQRIGLYDRYYIHDAVYSQGEYWLGEKNWGLIRVNSSGEEIYHPSGPNSNSGYCMHAAANHIYALVGGRWAGEYIRDFRMNIYDGLTWRSIDEYVVDGIANLRILDPVSIAVDPQDAGHFFVATYGTGVLEFRDYTLTQRYTYTNSTLKPVNATIDKPEYYTRTDGAMLDEQGNLWVLNATDIGQPLHILSPNGQWHALRLYPNGTNLTFTTPSGIWVDRRSTKRKWMFDQRSTQGVILLDDGGTPFSSGDDRCVKRSEFIDQNGKLIAPSTFQCFAQDHNDRIWIGTEKGLFLLKAETDFFTSNACYRIIIPRNDGTGLGDYLMGDEQINCMAVDGGNRMWIGTAGSGLYLIEDDTITVAHFTETNSLLPSNSIQSITIHPTTGEVFVGTDNGIASYRSDASEAQETMENAYAYPNPVRPGYSGVITITGLMDNSEVRIIDSGGNLVCKTRSHGGTAVWDGKDAYGKRATPGIYTALCNTTGGHTAVKIMFIP